MKSLPMLLWAAALAGCGSPAMEESAAPPAAPAAASVPEVPGLWTFEGDAEGGAPAGFTFDLAGKGRPGSWVVRAEAGAPSGGRVLAQVDADPTDLRFPVALADGAAVRDLRLSVKYRTVAGAVDRASGLAFRAADGKNYLLVRANALEGNVALFRVVRGVREMLRSADAVCPDGAWTELAVEAAGDSVAVFLAGKEVLRATDPAIGMVPAGRVGVWTKADSVTLFDDLRLEPR